MLARRVPEGDDLYLDSNCVQPVGKRDRGYFAPGVDCAWTREVA